MKNMIRSMLILISALILAFWFIDCRKVSESSDYVTYFIYHQTPSPSITPTVTITPYVTATPTPSGWFW
mgnify:FL=1